MVERLRHCERECTARLPLMREDGRAVTVTAPQAIHHTIHPYSIARLEVRPQGSQRDGIGEVGKAVHHHEVGEAPAV